MTSAIPLDSWWKVCGPFIPDLWRQYQIHPENGHWTRMQISYLSAYLPTFILMAIPGLASAASVYFLHRSTQPCIPPGSLNRVPAEGWGKGGILTTDVWSHMACEFPVAVKS